MQRIFSYLNRRNRKDMLFQIIMLILHGNMCGSQCMLECVQSSPRITFTSARCAIKLCRSVSS
jgi:hypothetical protein